MTAVVLRTPSEDEWELFRDVRLRALREDPGAFGSNAHLEADRAEAEWRARCPRMTLAFLDGEAVGMAGWFAHDGTCEIVGMWVAPEARRRGIGAGLVERVVAHLRYHRPGMPIVLGHVDDNLTARALYLGLGFVDAGVRSPKHLDHGRFIDHLHLPPPPLPTDLPIDVDQLVALPGVVAVGLGGSRAIGADRATSDWDLVLWHDGTFDPADLRALGHAGDVGDHGSWGPVMQGGAWLDLPAADGPVRVDVIYRDLDRARAEVAAAKAGEVTIVRHGNFVAGAPTYLLAGEVALARTIRGALPGDVQLDEYPAALAESATAHWRSISGTCLAFGRHHASRGDALLATGHLVVAALAEAHARLATDRCWVFHEKHLLERAGLVAAGDAARRGDAGAVAALLA